MSVFDQFRKLSQEEDERYELDHYQCRICKDQTWMDPVWCDGFGEGIGKVRRSNLPIVKWCGSGKHHQGHSYTPGRCDCWQRAQIGRPVPETQPAKRRAR